MKFLTGFIFCWLCLFSFEETKAQYFRPERNLFHDKYDTISTPKNFDFHFSMGTEVGFSSYNSYSLFWVAPEFSYQISPKVRFNGGFLLGTDFLFNTPSVDLSPRKSPKPVASTYGEIIYHPNERLWLSAAVFYDNRPLFSPFFSSYDAETIGMSASVAYKISENSLIDFHISIQRTEFQGGFNNYNPLSPGLDNSFTRTERLIKNNNESPFRLFDRP